MLLLNGLANPVKGLSPHRSVLLQLIQLSGAWMEAELTARRSMASQDLIRGALTYLNQRLRRALQESPALLSWLQQNEPAAQQFLLILCAKKFSAAPAAPLHPPQQTRPASPISDSAPPASTPLPPEPPPPAAAPDPEHVLDRALRDTRNQLIAAGQSQFATLLARNEDGIRQMSKLLVARLLRLLPEEDRSTAARRAYRGFVKDLHKRYPHFASTLPAFLQEYRLIFSLLTGRLIELLEPSASPVSAMEAESVSEDVECDEEAEEDSLE